MPGSWSSTDLAGVLSYSEGASERSAATREGGMGSPLSGRPCSACLGQNAHAVVEVSCGLSVRASCGHVRGRSTDEPAAGWPSFAQVTLARGKRVSQQWTGGPGGGGRELRGSRGGGSSGSGQVNAASGWVAQASWMQVGLARVGGFCPSRRWMGGGSRESDVRVGLVSREGWEGWPCGSDGRVGLAGGLGRSASREGWVVSRETARGCFT